MQVLEQELPPIGTNGYLLLDAARKEIVVVDAPLGCWEWASSVAASRACRVVALVLTHGHWDHMLDGAKFAEAGVPIYGHQLDRILFESPEVMTAFAIPGIDLVGFTVDHWLAGGDSLNLIGRRFELRHVPGHCPGSLLLYEPEAGVAFVGDAIFAGSVGRYDLPGGDFEQLEHSIRSQIYTLPDSTRLCPGHGPATEVGREKKTNPFVRG